MNQSSESTINPPALFGCSLSGGGFRATLFHLGVVRLLYETGLLSRTKFISGVSGGAILAAHLGLNWHRYIGNTQEFESAAAEIVRFARRDLRNRILRRWILAWMILGIPRFILKWSRVELLHREYTTLFGSRKLSELPNVYEGNAPRVSIQSTSLTTGLPCTFGRTGLMLYEEQADGRGLKLAPEKELTTVTNLAVAYAVAASSAFPPMFPPLYVDNTLLSCSKQEFPLAHYLTDGGVFDNMGMDRPSWWYSLQQHSVPEDQIDSFLLSDAEGPFSLVAEKPWRFKFAVPRNIRATEVLMKRASTLNWKFLSALPLKLVRVPEPGSAPNAKTGLELAQSVRTDLDHFSNLEIEELIHAGFRATRVALINQKWIPNTTPTMSWSPVPASALSPEKRVKKLKAARFRRWIPLFIAPRDWAWWILLALILGLLSLWSFRLAKLVTRL